MSNLKFPITRRERFKLRQKCIANNENEDSCSLYSRSEAVIPAAGRYDAPQVHPGGDGGFPLSPGAADDYSMADDVFDSVPNGADVGRGDASMIDPTRQSIGEISIPPSVPSEYQFPWPPQAPMHPIPEESFYSGRSGYDFKYDASACDVFWCIWALVTYLFDVGSDIFVALIYFKHGHTWWFIMTLSFIIVPALIMTIFSLVLYIHDWKIVGDKSTPIRWASRIIFLVLQLGPLLRIIDTLYYACKSRSVKKTEEKMHFFERMVDEDVDSMLLRLFEAFMEAAPQLVLQLYILSGNGLNDGWTLVALQFMSLCSSLVTLAMTLVSFQKALRQSQGAKAKLNWCGMAGQFLWRLFTIGTRVVALAMFAHYFKWWVFVVCAVHYIIMFVWISQQRTTYCMMERPDGEVHHKKVLEFGFHILAAFVHIFAFFNLLEGHTRLRAILYYAITYLENCGLILAWYIASSTSLFAQPEAYQAPVVGLVMGGFWAGIFFMMVYYKFCHPNNSSLLPEHESIKLCVPSNEMFLCGPEQEEEKDIKIATLEEKQQMTGEQQLAARRLNMSYEQRSSIRSSGPRKCVDPIPRTETPKPHNISISYREPSPYDSYAQLNTSKRSINPNPRLQAPQGHSIAYREPATLDSLLENKSTTV